MASSTSPSTTDRTRPLRVWLGVDATTCAVPGILVVAGAPLVAPVLGYPAAFLVPVGCVLIACGVLFGLLASGRGLTTKAVRGVIGFNALWVVASVALVVSGAFGPTTVGVVVMIAQAVGVAGIAACQAMTLRTATPSLAS
ncbi:hypothetical protein J4H86_02540 [Spiractinospora alimapuensis]|uniref:hypothetical protein n=1 Tax=Spiractinospora alimapuensis TaxID=2820884 RepID=UPI001F3755B2|nr:hypothetical protein [Spiractinospora alimapuensis]QVQ52726.1 hypothetical protein J4H86_02540 [Spiractinospora alimapuensis]